VGNAGG